MALPIFGQEDRCKRKKRRSQRKSESMPTRRGKRRKFPPAFGMASTSGYRSWEKSSNKRWDSSYNSNNGFMERRKAWTGPSFFVRDFFFQVLPSDHVFVRDFFLRSYPRTVSAWIVASSINRISDPSILAMGFLLNERRSKRNIAFLSLVYGWTKPRFFILCLLIWPDKWPYKLAR